MTSQNTNIIWNIHVKRVSFLWCSAPPYLWPNHSLVMPRLRSIWEREERASYNRCPKTLTNMYACRAVGLCLVCDGARDTSGSRICPFCWSICEWCTGEWGWMLRLNDDLPERDRKRCFSSFRTPLTGNCAQHFIHGAVRRVSLSATSPAPSRELPMQTQFTLLKSLLTHERGIADFVCPGKLS